MSQYQRGTRAGFRPAQGCNRHDRIAYMDDATTGQHSSNYLGMCMRNVQINRVCKIQAVSTYRMRRVLARASEGKQEGHRPCKPCQRSRTGRPTARNSRMSKRLVCRGQWASASLLPHLTMRTAPSHQSATRRKESIEYVERSVPTNPSAWDWIAASRSTGNHRP